MSDTKPENDLITIAVVDDDTYIRNGLTQLLNNVVGMTCVGAYATPDEFLSACAHNPPDLLLLDVSLNGSSGIDAIPRIHERLPKMTIMMHSNYDDHDNIVRSREAGARGYVFKNSSAPHLYHAIVEVARGGSVWPPGYDFSKKTAGEKTLMASLRQTLGFLLGRGKKKM